MTRILATLLRWVCDPAKLEAFAGDLAELYGERFDWRCLQDVVSVCVHHSRLRTLNRRVLLPLATAAVLLVLTGPRPASAFHYSVSAVDPAGHFTLEIRDRLVIAATLNGNPVRPEHVVQTGDTLVLKGGDGGRDFRIAIKPQGGITWAARQPALTP
ncbi:MAG TPA: hypothetical protein VGQ06_08430 [Gemmatimonadales bacterium]|jgi:hypothetical protein|nr:hypothetical protein [Gemmatimonadales bacterium]